jgi:serine/threonine protein phosphatase 1
MQDLTTPDRPARLYVIGDIHGRLDLLDRAIAAIERDGEERGPDALTVTLGDYIDTDVFSNGRLTSVALDEGGSRFSKFR